MGLGFGRILIGFNWKENEEVLRLDELIHNKIKVLYGQDFLGYVEEYTGLFVLAWIPEVYLQRKGDAAQIS